jgi:hypothetical protein
MTDLSHFLDRAAGRQFSWSRWDCLCWLGEWVAIRHGENPAELFHGTYSNGFGALRVIARHGGIVSLVASLVEPLGINRAAEVQAGDIVISDAPEGHVGGIATGRYVANVGTTGLYYRRPPVLAAWRI